MTTTSTNAKSSRSGAPSERARVRRLNQRAGYDPQTLHSVLDATPVCHLGFNDPAHGPVVTPMLHWREGDHVYLHGSAASRALRASGGADVCLTVTLVDGFVIARSAFHHSMNYRCAMVFGRAAPVDDPAEKEERLRMFMERLFPGRWEMLRPITAQEIKATSVLSLPLTEASTKIRSGPPVDDEEDYALPIWAGITELETRLGAPISDGRTPLNVEIPTHVANMRFYGSKDG